VLSGGTAIVSAHGNARSTLLANNQRQDRGTEVDVAGAYNGVFLSVKRTGPRTSMIVDPPTKKQGWNVIDALTCDPANLAKSLRLS
jgi:hypothetical protein